MDILEHFGINYALIAAQIVNFLIILFVLKKYVYKPIFDTFKKREAVVKESIEKNEEARQALEKAQKEEKEIIKKAQATANQVIKDAKEQASVILKDAEEAAKKQTKELLEESKVQIMQETKHAEQQLNKHVSRLSVELLKKSLANVFNDDEQTEIVAKAVKEIEKRPN